MAFTTASHFMQHSLTHLPASDLHQHMDTGSDCGNKEFVSANPLQQHLSTSSDQPFICNACGRCFKDQADLSMHKETHIQQMQEFVMKKAHNMHNVTRNKCYICHCGELFNTKRSFNTHLLTHNMHKRTRTVYVIQS